MASFPGPRPVAFVLALILAAPALSGCGGSGGPSRYRVHGRVTFQGQPVPAGSIHFDPDTSRGNAGPQGFAPIKDGRYDTSQGGRGTVGGPHVVRISAFDGIPPSDDAPQGKPLFPAYTTTVDLAKDTVVQDFDVTPAAKLDETRR